MTKFKVQRKKIRLVAFSTTRVPDSRNTDKLAKILTKIDFV